MRLIVIATALILCGCTKTITMVYHSQPEGAAIVQDGKTIGRSPVTMKYQAPATFNDGGCAALGQTGAVWQSGVSTAPTALTVCKQNTYLQHVVIQRPDAPGLEADVAAALPRPAPVAEDSGDGLLGAIIIAGALSSSRPAPPPRYQRSASPAPVTPVQSSGFPAPRGFTSPTTYQKIGNTVYGSDGTSCQRTGDVVTCK
ncbi:hypothetical protein [Luteibacter yeojuensis]|uniref:Lipoprotein n=1 Tax=Luteibacter yeojuensis TaxID=345309 RepID=A0A7X5QTH1_9GAMM|nr:hypothetical protein [Luteibacter yeojuensis]NID14997.1 hypothetical protein [Luteibacter yeojuensis]